MLCLHKHIVEEKEYKENKQILFGGYLTNQHTII